MIFQKKTSLSMIKAYVARRSKHAGPRTREGQRSVSGRAPQHLTGCVSPSLLPVEGAQLFKGTTSLGKAKTASRLLIFEHVNGVILVSMTDKAIMCRHISVFSAGGE